MGGAAVTASEAGLKKNKVYLWVVVNELSGYCGTLKSLKEQGRGASTIHLLNNYTIHISQLYLIAFTL